MIVRMLVIAAFVAGQLGASAAPALAADLVNDGAAAGTRTGAFAGARLRVSLDPEPRERVRAGLAFAPTARALRSDGGSRLRIGEGVELELSGREAPQLTFGGRPVDRFAPGGGAPEARSNVSTVGWVAIGVGVAAIALAAWFFHEMADCDEHDDEC